MNRQYIGARYVPKFFEGESGSSEWVSGLTYEAMIIVTYLGNTFVSKKPVPSNIGAPNLNRDYWANMSFLGGYDELKSKVEDLDELTTALSESIESINDNISDITEDIAVLSDEHIVCVGDSYLEGYTPSGSVTSWGTHLKNKLAMDDNHFHMFYHGGYKFGDGSLNSLLNDAVSSMSSFEKQKVKYVICCGSYNDSLSTADNIDTHIRDFVGTASSNFPNAKIYIMPIGWSCVPKVTDPVHTSTTYEQLRNAIANWYAAIKSTGAITCPYSYAMLMDNRCFSSDYVHPNSTGQNLIALMILYTLRGSKVPFFDTYAYQPLNEFVPNGTLSLPINHNLNGEEMIISMVGDATFTPTSNVTVTANGSTQIELGSYKDSAIPGGNRCQIPVELYFKAGNYYYTLNNATLQFNGSKVYLHYGAQTTEDHTNFLSVTNVSQFYFRCHRNTRLNSLFNF